MLCCAAVGLSTLGFAFAALFLSLRPLWLMLGFELVTLTAAIIGVRFSRGHFQNGQALALACIAACFFVGSVLSYVSVNGMMQTSATAGGTSLNGYLVGRLIAAGFIGLVAALLALSRSRASRPYLLRALLAALPLAILAIGTFLTRGIIAPYLAALPGAILVLLVLLAGLLAVILVSASLHCLIRAFEQGRPTH